MLSHVLCSITFQHVFDYIGITKNAIESNTEGVMIVLKMIKAVSVPFPQIHSSCLCIVQNSIESYWPEGQGSYIVVSTLQF